MKKSKKTLMGQAAHLTPTNTGTETATATETETETDTTATNIVLTEWDKAWQGYCKFAVGLRPDERVSSRPTFRTDARRRWTPR